MLCEQLVGQLGERRRAGGSSPPPRQRQLTVGGDVGDDLLGEDVERVAQVVGVLDLAVDHAPGDDRGLEQVAAVLRVDRAPARLADLVAGPADALQATAHGTRRLDLDDEVDGAHVDAELEAAGGDDGPQVAALELVLDDDPLLARQRPVVRLDEVDGVARPGRGRGRCLCSSASSLSLAARRSAWRRALQNTMVERWARICSRMRG